MSVMRELRRRVSADRPVDFEPCLSRPAKAPPAGPDWIHEIKHDGFRVIARRDGKHVRLITRNGYNFADRFPLAAVAIPALPARSCAIDGEAIACDPSGLAVFDLIRYGRGRTVTFCAFDLIELDGRDLRNEPIEERKRKLAGLLKYEHPGIAFNRHFDVAGAIVFKHACAPIDAFWHFAGYATAAKARKPFISHL